MRWSPSTAVIDKAHFQFIVPPRANTLSHKGAKPWRLLVASRGVDVPMGPGGRLFPAGPGRGPPPAGHGVGAARRPESESAVAAAGPAGRSAGVAGPDLRLVAYLLAADKYPRLTRSIF